MRISRLLPVAVLASLFAAVPATAADQSADVVDYAFEPKGLKIDPGDTVTWSFKGPTEHTATSDPGQAEKWDSGLKGVGGTYSHTFDTPGKFQYFCLPHEGMVGSVTVGTDSVAKSFTAAKLAGGARSIKLTVTLKEDAKVTFSAKKGKKTKRVSKRLKKGKRSLTIKKLGEGTYSTTVTAQDDFDKKTTKKGKADVG
jgi:plastocyanin